MVGKGNFETMKIIFVGIHNKKGFEPLDSRTKTGNIIDRIIERCDKGFEFEKTNLFDRDEMPKGIEASLLIHQFKENINPVSYTHLTLPTICSV